MGNTQEKREILDNYARYLKIKRHNSDCTIQNAMYKISAFLNWLKENNISVNDINQNVIDDYIHFCKQKYANNSLIPITIDLKKFIKFLDKDIELKYPRPRAPERDKQALTKDEVKAIFNVAKSDPLNLAILQTLYTSGMRLSELINLDVSDVDFDRLQIIIRHGKGDRYRMVNITQECASSIQRWLRVRPRPICGHEKALFISPKKQRVSSYYVSTMVKRVAAKAGISKNVYPHKFRITMITHMAEAGLSPRDIASQSGHQNLITLLEYIQHNPQRIRESYNRVFEHSIIDKQSPEEINKIRPELSDQHYKKMVLQKYLDGEIDIQTMNSILTTLDNRENKVKKSPDPSYA